METLKAGKISTEVVSVILFVTVFVDQDTPSAGFMDGFLSDTSPSCHVEYGLFFPPPD